MSLTENNSIINKNKQFTYFSWSKQNDVKPIVISKAKGIYFWDNEGKKYADFSSQLMCTNIGHGDERVNQAIIEQMNTGVHYVQPGNVTQVRGELGELLASVLPGDLNKTFFTLGGADGIENAMKIARLYTGKQKIITRYRSYHGGTFAAACAGGDPRRMTIEPGVGWIVKVHDPYHYRSPIYRHCTQEQGDMLNCDLIEETIRLEGPGTVAAILLEGYSGSSGIIAPISTKYWQRIRQMCDEFNILLIIDEVMSGFGRTGKWFGINHYNIIPDILVMAKGLTSAYAPLGAVATNQKISNFFDSNFFACGLTYNAHAISCAAAKAVLNIYKSDFLIENAALQGQLLEQKLNLLADKHPSIGEIRGKGLHWCVELVKNRKTREEMSEWNKPMSKPMLELVAYLNNNGISTFVRWNHVYICPPLIVTEQQVNEALEIYSRAFEITDCATIH